MPDRFLHDDPTIPPPGKRSGNGSGSVLPYLTRVLAAKPRQASSPEFTESTPPTPECGDGHAPES